MKHISEVLDTVLDRMERQQEAKEQQQRVRAILDKLRAKRAEQQGKVA
ncbi:hypothetical protein JQR85_13640 [Stutzerimonas urumqiensis]